MPFIFVGLLSLFILYQWLTFNYFIDLPFLSMKLDHFIATTLNYVALHWAIVVAIMGVFYSIAGLVALKNEAGKPYKIGMLVFYIFYCFLLIL